MPRISFPALRFLNDPYALVGCLIYLIFVMVALLAPMIAPFDPTEILFTPDGQLASSLPPGAEHWLGTTNLGRDIFSQLVLGAQPSLLVGVTAAIGVSAIGTIVGLAAGYFGGWTDAVLMRIADIVLGIPFLPFVVVLALLLHPGLGNVVFCVVVLLWPNAARVIRSQVLILRERQFIEAARMSAAGEWRILIIHLAPSVLPLSFVYASIAMGWAIVTEASVSFLGFGATDTISWGTMLQDAYASQALSRGQYLWFVPPGICIILIVLAGFLLGRGTEQILSPKLRD